MTATLLAMMCTLFSYSQSNLNIEGYAPQLKDGTAIYITPVYPRRYAKEQESETKYILKNPSLVVKNGRFSSIISVRNGDVYSLSINGVDGFKIICLSPGKLVVNIPGSSLGEIKLDGNKTTEEYERYRKQVEESELYKAYSKVRTEWINARIARDAELVDTKARLQDSLNKELDKFTFKIRLGYFKRYPDSYINCYLLNNSLSIYSEAQIKKIFKSFTKNQINNSYGDNLKYLVDSLFVGGCAPLFTQKDTAGNLVNLRSYKGKYILIDFWASWCVPCRGDNPSLVKAMKDYGEKNFEIISVSLDTDKKAWIDAIQKDNLNWIHVSDLQKYKNQVSVSYDIYSIPANFLIDPSGKIIAKNLKGEELLKMLKDLKF